MVSALGLVVAVGVKGELAGVVEDADVSSGDEDGDGEFELHAGFFRRVRGIWLFARRERRGLGRAAGLDIADSSG